MLGSNVRNEYLKKTSFYLLHVLFTCWIHADALQVNPAIHLSLKCDLISKALYWSCQLFLSRPKYSLVSFLLVLKQPMQ